MDDLALLRLRLNELIDAKLARRVALVEEIASIDLELQQAKAVLSGWVQPAAASAARSDKTARAAEPKPVAVAKEIKMPLVGVIDFLSAVGPQDRRRIVDQFFGRGADGRCGAILAVWVRDGHLVQHADGRFAAARPTINVDEMTATSQVPMADMALAL